MKFDNVKEKMVLVAVPTILAFVFGIIIELLLMFPIGANFSIFLLAYCIFAIVLTVRTIIKNFEHKDFKEQKYMFMFMNVLNCVIIFCFVFAAIIVSVSLFK